MAADMMKQHATVNRQRKRSANCPVSLLQLLFLGCLQLIIVCCWQGAWSASRSRQGSSEKYCSLPNINQTAMLSDCRIKYKQADRTLVLSNCLKSTGTSGHASCGELYEGADICKVQIELGHWASHGPIPFGNRLKSCDNRAIHYEFVLINIDTSTTENNNNNNNNNNNDPGESLFENINNWKIQSAIIKQCSFTGLNNLIHSNFRNAETIEVFKNSRPLRLRAQLVNSKLTRLKTFRITSSPIDSIEPETFNLLGGLSQQVQLTSSDLLKPLASRSLVMGCSQSLRPVHLELGLEQMRLTQDQLSNDFIWTRPDGVDCAKGSSLSLSMTGNRFKWSLSEALMYPILDRLLKMNANQLKLRADPIECCDDNSDWLIQLARKYPATLVADVSCQEFSLKLANLEDKQNYRKLCDSYPTLMVAIVVATVLIVLLVGLSLICLFVVIPRRRQLRRRAEPASPISGLAPIAAKKSIYHNQQQQQSPQSPPKQQRRVASKSSNVQTLVTKSVNTIPSGGSRSTVSTIRSSENSRPSSKPVTGSSLAEKTSKTGKLAQSQTLL